MSENAETSKGRRAIIAALSGVLLAALGAAAILGRGQPATGQEGAYERTRNLTGSELARGLGLKRYSYEIEEEFYKLPCTAHLVNAGGGVAYCLGDLGIDGVQGYEVAYRILENKQPSAEQMRSWELIVQAEHAEERGNEKLASELYEKSIEVRQEASDEP
jgi:hypothetical protein